jgi:hypothetical protein
LCDEKVGKLFKLKITHSEFIYRHQLQSIEGITCRKKKSLAFSQQSLVMSIRSGDESKKNLINVKPFDISSMVHTKTNFRSSLTANLSLSKLFCPSNDKNERERYSHVIDFAC